MLIAKMGHDLSQPPGRSSPSLPYLPHVDGLRALAVALVVVFHAWPQALTGGFIGVDVFFVISGFIITRQILSEMEAGTFSFLSFLGRRARRLIPAALVCCLVVTAAAFIILMPDALVLYSESLAATWTMTANFYFFQHSGYFDAPAAVSPLLHMWSLAVEDQFYLTWPLLLLLLVRKLATRGRIIAAMCAIALVSLAYAQYSARTDPSLAFYLPLSRVFELLTGAALAGAYPLIRAPAAWARAALDTAGVILVVVSAMVLDASIPFPGLSALPAVIGSALVIGAGLYGPTPVARLLSGARVVLMGRMSYSIYLYHWPLIALATYALGRAPDAGEAALLVATGLILAALSWVYVEQALTRQLGLYSMAPMQLIGRTVAISTAFCLVAVAGLAGRGWPERLDEPAYRVYRAAAAGNPLRKACDGYDQAFKNDHQCNFGSRRAEGGSYDIAVFGDSNADHFVPMIAELAEKAGFSGRQVTHSACGALIGADSAGRPQREAETCARYQETILEFLDRNPGLKIAVLSSAWRGYRNAAPNRVSQHASGERVSFERAAADTIAILRKRGIEVLVIGQVPHLETFSLNCLADAARNDSEEMDCATPKAKIDTELDTSELAFRSIAAGDRDVTFISMRDLLCTGAICSPFKDEVLIYRDHGHLNAVGAAYLSRYATLPELEH